MPRNSDLKASLQLLSEKVLPIFEAHVAKTGEYSRDLVMISITLHKLEDGVKDLKEFKESLKLMKGDKAITGIQGKLVGDASRRGIVQDEESCLLSFLKQLYLKSNEYSQETFETDYDSFEDFFYEDHLKFRESSPLYNFECSEAEVELTDGMRIIRRRPEAENAEHGMFRGEFDLRNSTFEIELISERPKLVGDVEDGLGQAIPEQTRIGACFDDVVASLRILKKSSVYRGEEIKTENITFHPMSGTSIRKPFHRTVATGEKCTLEISEIGALKRIFKFVEGANNTRFIVAQRRLSSGNERPDIEDKLIDYMIGLEALYLPDGNQELTFRLALRAALVLETDIEKKKDTFNFLKQAYNTRSSIVHGSKYKLDEESVERVEKILRSSIKKWIENEDTFSTNVKESGILKKEGNLDTLFFS